MNTSAILIETLIAWGAPFVFGIVGDGINPIIETSVCNTAKQIILTEIHVPVAFNPITRSLSGYLGG